MSADVRDRLAALAVDLGANVQPDQVVALNAPAASADLARAVAAHAYKRGARFVDVEYFDPYVKRARVEHADEDSLDYVPPWYGERMLALGQHHCARIALAAPPPDGIYAGLDASRLGKDQLPWLKEVNTVINDRTTNWTIVPAPTEHWAELVHGDGEGGLERLWGEIEHVCRLDEADPAAAWRERMDALQASAGRLTARRFDALHFQGPGTDLTVGLLPSSRWESARFRTVDDVVHLPNIPTEEIFTSPDPARADGTVTSTRPLVVGPTIRGLVVRFEGGRAVEIDAEEGADTIRQRCSVDEGAARLGEVALVDNGGRIGPLGTVFQTTLLDENAASHIAFGSGFGWLVDESDRAKVNASDLHIDFMVGGDDVDVTGMTRDGERVPVLRGGAWQI